MKELEPDLHGYISSGQRTAILGVGSVLRCDDAAGMHFADCLASRIQRDDVLIIAGSTAPENFTGVIKDFAPDRLFIVDAARMGLQIGEMREIDIKEIGGMAFSTHMLPLPVMLSYLALETKCSICCIGIQPGSTEQGFSMSQEVRGAAEQLAGLFCRALNVGKN